MAIKKLDDNTVEETTERKTKWTKEDIDRELSTTAMRLEILKAKQTKFQSMKDLLD